MPNNLVSLKPAEILGRIETTLTMNCFLYKTQGDDFALSRDFAQKCVFAHCDENILLLKKQSTWFEAHWCEAFLTAQVAIKI